jgi:hypothetical protein
MQTGGDQPGPTGREQPRDRSITFRLQEEAAGVEVRAPAVDPGKAATFVRTHPEGDR